MSADRLPRLIILDMDDTILRHSEGTEDLWRETCRYYASLIEGTDPETLFNVTYSKNRWYWSDVDRHREGRLDIRQARRYIVELAFAEIGIDNGAIAHRLADTFTDKREDLVALFPESIDTLRKLKSNGIRLAMITNGESVMQRNKIRKFGLEPYFELITIEEEFGEGKPEPSVFIHTLDYFGIKADEAWMVGDDLDRDIRGANATGIFAIWIDLQKKGLPENAPAVPNRIIHSIKELYST